VAALGSGTTLLVDTFDVHRGVEAAVRAAGTELGAVRLDSGDLLELASAVRRQLDGLGATGTKIVVTSDLDEYAIAALAAAPVDSYGVGTSLVTGSGAPTAGMVYKLVAREGPNGTLQPVAKRSDGKVGVGGRKWAGRRVGADGLAVEELLSVGVSLAGRDDVRELQVPYVSRGETVNHESLADARDRHAASLANLPVTARQLSRGEPVIPTLYQQAEPAEEIG
jgi:nicotinate phosphoribosyltransferase